MSESQLNKKRRLDRQLSTTNDEDDGAREEASKDSLTLLHARNRGLATNLYVYKRKITSLSGALEDASKSKGQLEEAISFFHRRLGHLEADIQAMLSQLSDVYSGEFGLLSFRSDQCASRFGLALPFCFLLVLPLTPAPLIA